MEKDNTENVKCFRCGQWSHDKRVDLSNMKNFQAYHSSASVIDVHLKDKTGCYAAVLCCPCVDEYEPDIWIDQEWYEKLNPMVPADKLPKLLPLEASEHDPYINKPWDVLSYEWPL